MITEAEIIDFIESEFWKSELLPDSDVFKTVRIDGDDCTELLQKYAEKYKVDMTGLLWYFHFQEEGSLMPNVGGLFFRNPHRRVETIPITPKMLAQFANAGKWDIDYPEHHLPKYRKDILLNWAILILAIIFVAYVKFIR